MYIPVRARTGKLTKNIVRASANVLDNRGRARFQASVNMMRKLFNATAKGHMHMQMHIREEGKREREREQLKQQRKIQTKISKILDTWCEQVNGQSKKHAPKTL